VPTDLGVSERLHGELLERALLMEERLRLLSRKLLAAQEEERMRISRDLHDVAGLTRYAIAIGSIAGRDRSAAG
jgi:signal transduction histidine kinase